MSGFAYAHATHPAWEGGCGLVLAQLRAQLAARRDGQTPSLGLLYLTDRWSHVAQPILELLGTELPFVSDWAGTVGVGIAATGVEYWDEPALAVLLLDLPSDQYRVFSGVAPLARSFRAHSALVHADPGTTDLPDLLRELAQRTEGRALFGGLSSARGSPLQFALSGNGTLAGQGLSSGVFSGGLSGVAFGAQVRMVSRLTQGCSPMGRTHRVSHAEQHLVYTLDDEPALEVLRRDLQLHDAAPAYWVDALRATLVGWQDGRSQPPALVGAAGNFGAEGLVRHIIGIDVVQGALAVADRVPQGAELVFCQRNVQAARADLMRMCTEVRDEFDTASMAGALYVSCAGRGGDHFGGDSAELQIVRRALGDVPLVGFFAGGEIAHDRLFGYTGVLTVWGHAGVPTP